MKKRDWIEWAKRAGVRAGKTVAQAAIAGIGTAAAMGQVDWKYVVSASALAGVLSLLTSVAGLPELESR
ncbi:holin [uncultured Acetatifactor sp.]|uniref:holin n=1 Tax=uncultured Acetatifactor sp. TaxID=1671927 RepID=UPI002626FF05|nr:holin [uncultured Acetatifactor sp.]